MKVARIKEKKVEKNNKIEISQNEYSIKKIILTLVIVAAVFFLFYFITILIVKPNEKTQDENKTPVILDPTLITLNHLLDRKENEYYVLASKSDTKPNFNDIYDGYLSDYKNKEEALKVYKVDLSDSFNDSYKGETNITNDLGELKVNEDVLFKIKDKSIVEHYIGSTDIIDALSKL